MKKVTVIIPNYNGLKFMEPCFAALERQNYRDFDILVVDNGSEDGSAQWLREREIPTLFMGENTGFSGAVNAGILSGTGDSTLAPQGQATRAQAAVMLTRLCELGR